MISVRLLSEADAAAYYAIRLRALRDHPEAYGSSAEEFSSTTVEQMAEKLRTGLPDRGNFGAFEGDQLVGIVTMSRYTHLKSRHRAMLTGMYTAPEVRGQRVGQQLVAAALNFAQQMDGVEDVVLAVTAGNNTARHLYKKAGFTHYSTEPRSLKIGTRYYDFEWMLCSLQSGT